jgi:hypothetical protein
MFPWKGELGSINLPRESPGSINLFKHIEGDVFQKIRRDDKPGNTIVFERNEEGEVTRYWQQFNYKQKISR